MTQRHLATDFRAGFEILAGAPYNSTRWRQFEQAVGRLVRGRQTADREDFIQSFIEWLLRRRDVLNDCVQIADDELVGRCGQLVRRYAHEVETKTQVGKLRKALDDVLREDPRFIENGKIIITTEKKPPAMPSEPFHACGTRLDHGKLGDAAVCVVFESGVIHGRSAIARELAHQWALERLPDDLYTHEHPRSAEDQMALGQAITDATATLEPREHRLVGDAVLGLPLRTAKERVGLSPTAAHDARRAAGRKLAAIATAHGLDRDDCLKLVEAFAA